MEVCYLTSGETFAVLAADEFEGKSAKVVKQSLVAQVGVSRFRQKLWREDGCCEIQDDQMFDCAPAKVQLVVLEFWEPDAEQGQKMMTASEDNDLAALEKLLLRPLNPNLTDKDGRTPLHSAARAGHVKAMELLLEGGAKKDALDAGEGFSPLHEAARQGHLDAVRLLVAAGADKNQPTTDHG
jgi:hypothetical protein